MQASIVHRSAIVTCLLATIVVASCDATAKVDAEPVFDPGEYTLAVAHVYHSHGWRNIPTPTSFASSTTDYLTGGTLHVDERNRVRLSFSVLTVPSNHDPPTAGSGSIYSFTGILVAEDTSITLLLDEGITAWVSPMQQASEVVISGFNPRIAKPEDQSVEVGSEGFLYLGASSLLRFVYEPATE